MEVYYIDIEKFKKQHKKSFLESYADIELKSEKRFYEYTIGRYLVKTVAEKSYGIKDTKIILNENGKPVFKNANLYFSISHSKNVLMTCFDNFPCGIDVEYNKIRDLMGLSKYFNREFKDLKSFYKFWTYKEAAFKLGEKAECSYFDKLEDEYYFTITSQKIIDKTANRSAELEKPGVYLRLLKCEQSAYIVERV